LNDHSQSADFTALDRDERCLAYEYTRFLLRFVEKLCKLLTQQLYVS